MFASDDVDAVAICSSTDTHVPLLIEAAESGKAIFCEKPISLDLAKVDEALAIVREAGVPIQVGFNRRFDAAHKSVRDAVADGLLGDVHLVRITSRDPAPPPIEYIKLSGGIFLDMTIHDFDMARYVTGSEVVEVYAQGAVRVDPAIGDAGDIDTAAVMLRHENGCITTIDNSRQAVYGYDQRVEAFGSGGMAASENPLAHTGVRRTAAGTSAPLLPFFFLDRYIPSYIAQWEAFRDYVVGGGPSPVTADDGRAAARDRPRRLVLPPRAPPRPHLRDPLTLRRPPPLRTVCFKSRLPVVEADRTVGWGSEVEGHPDRVVDGEAVAGVEPAADSFGSLGLEEDPPRASAAAVVDHDLVARRCPCPARSCARTARRTRLRSRRSRSTSST